MGAGTGLPTSILEPVGDSRRVRFPIRGQARMDARRESAPHLSEPNSPGSSRESSRSLPGCLIRTFRYLTICARQHGGYYYLGRDTASQEMVSFPGRTVAVHRFMTSRCPGVVGRGSAESREQGGVAPTRARTLLAQAERDCRHRPGALPPRRDGSRAPCARARWTPDPSPPELPPVPDSHFQERARACHHFWLPSDTSFFCVTGACCLVRHGIWGNRQAVRQRELDSHAKSPSMSRLRPDIERRVPAAGRCRALQPPGCAACTSPGSSRSRKRWVAPHPRSPSRTHHYDDCPVVPASWGRVGQSPKLPVTPRGKKKRDIGHRGEPTPCPRSWFPTPGLPAGWFGVMCDTPALTTHQPWRRPGISHLHCLADVEIQAPDAEI